MVLLLVSKSIFLRLKGHPILRMLQAFLPEKTTEAASCENEDRYREIINAQPKWKLGWNSVLRGHARHQICNSVWCRPSFIGSLQIALIKRLLIEYVAPLVERDKLGKLNRAFPKVWNQLDLLADDYSLLIKSTKIISQADSRRDQYCWFRFSIYPSQGRVVIRDQLYNQTLDISLPLLMDFTEFNHSTSSSPNQKLTASLVNDDCGKKSLSI